MQSVGVISKSTYWNGPRGIVTKIEVDVGHATLPELVSIRIQGASKATSQQEGTDTPVVTLSGDEGAVNKFAVNEWLDSSGELSEWHEETARYRAALGKVDLPCRFTKIDMGEKSLTYKLSMTEGGYNINLPSVGGSTIHLTVVVEYDKTTVSVTLAQGDYRYNRVVIGEGTILGPVNVHALRRVVKSALEEFIVRLTGLAELPITEAVAYS